MNPVAINFWLVGASTGFAFGHTQGAAIGLAITSTISLLLTFIQK